MPGVYSQPGVAQMPVPVQTAPLTASPWAAMASQPDPAAGAVSGQYPGVISGTAPATPAPATPGGSTAVSPWAMQMAAGDPATLAAMGYPVTGQPGAATQHLSDLANGLIGSDTNGAASQINSLHDKEDQAAAAKSAAIQNATNVLKQWNAGRGNLTGMAFAAGMLQPTHGGSFASSLGNAFAAAEPAEQTQQNMNLETARALGTLGVQAADTGLQSATVDYSNFMDRYKTAIEAAKVPATAEMYGIRAGATVGAAQVRAGATVGAAQVRSDATVDAANIRGNSANDVEAQRAVMQKYGVDAKTAMGMINAGIAQQRVNKTGTLTANEQATIQNQTYNQATMDPAWMAAKTDADRLKVYNAHRVGAGLPAAATLPGTIVPPAAPLTAAPAAAAPVPAAQAAPGATPQQPAGQQSLNSILGIQ